LILRSSKEPLPTYFFADWHGRSVTYNSMENPMPDLPIHFTTIVLNGEPFIRYHLDKMKALRCPWHWHIVEGLAELKHDTAWSLALGASLPTEWANQGLSIDGTQEYLDQIAAENPDNVTVYRPHLGPYWAGKLEMVNAPLANIPHECVLWQLDSDELWDTWQFQRMQQMFAEDSSRQAAIFHCNYFIGPDLVIDRRQHCPEIEWRRAWRYRPGMKWLAHEPPTLCARDEPGNVWCDIAFKKPFWAHETERQGLVFQHFAYVTEAQLTFKEKYYGYAGISRQWRRMQAETELPVRLKDYFNWPWVHPDAMVNTPKTANVQPLARLHNDRWEFAPPTTNAPSASRGVLYIKWGTQVDSVLDRSISSLKKIHPNLPIYVHQLADNASLLDKATMHRLTPFDETLYLDADTVVLDRLDFGFDMARQHGLACCICECPWARRYGGIGGDEVEYNTGVLFFTRKSHRIFETWREHAKSIDSSIKFYQNDEPCVMPYNDQAAFSLAVSQSPTAPFILPFNWNLRPVYHRSWWGPIKIWHDYRPPPPQIHEFSRQQANPDAIIRHQAFG
jgi:hypothetical protein